MWFPDRKCSAKIVYTYLRIIMRSQSVFEANLKPL